VGVHQFRKQILGTFGRTHENQHGRMEFGPTRNQLFQREEFPVFSTDEYEFLGDIGGTAGRDDDIDGGIRGPIRRVFGRVG